MTNAAKGRSGVVGLEGTLNAVHQGRVQTLVIQEGLRLPGSRCEGCSFVTSQKLESCPFCGGHFKSIPDSVELAVRNVMQSGGEVEVLHDPSPLEEHESIGALLRY
jgi:peptide subunit release factor 1 (eRF1)